MDIKKIIADNNFRFSHKLGQNFITDSNLLSAIVEDGGVTAIDTVVEIGAGAGTLTRELCKKANKVVAIEIDKNLQPILEKTLEDCQNVQLVFADIMKLGIAEIERLCGNKPYRVVANLPYYITTPIIMMFVEEATKCQSLTVMVQKEVADRFIALPSTADYGAITASINLCCNVKQMRKVGKNMFFPTPNVDSAVVRLDFANKFQNVDIVAVRKLIRQAFSMRRKTLANNLSCLRPKQYWEEKLISMSLPPNIRGEALGVSQFVKLCE